MLNLGLGVIAGTLQTIATGDLVEQWLGGAAFNHGVGDPIGMSLPGVTRATDIVLQAQTFPLLDHMCGLVGRETQRGLTTKPDSAARGEGERTHAAVRRRGATADTGAHLGDVVTAERGLDALAVGQRLAGVLEPPARIPVDPTRARR